MFLMLLGAFGNFACSSIHEEPVDACNLITKSEEGVAQNLFKLDREMLERYLKILGREVVSIEPYNIGLDTLAYYVKYLNGWEIVPADIRLAPSMIQSEQGACDKGDEDIQGLLQYVLELRRHPDGEISNTWKFLLSNNSDINVTKGGMWSDEVIYTTGMWRAIDTCLITEEIEIPHIVSTIWSQGYPWNEFRPIVEGTNVPVGCGAVATGQIIHHYRKNNAMNLQIPASAQSGSGVSNFSTTLVVPSWNTMALNKYDDNTLDVALFLAYLGQEIMHHNYNSATGGTVVNIDGVDRAFYWGKLNYDSRNSYNYLSTRGSLENGSPVCMYSSLTADSQGNTHVYIIDRYKENRTYYSINCVWDENYRVSEREYYSNPPEFFEQSAGSDEKEIQIDALVYTYFGMRWGYASQNFDSRWYMVREKIASSSDEAGIIDGYNVYYQPYWETSVGTVNGVSKMYYNFRNIQ